MTASVHRLPSRASSTDATRDAIVLFDLDHTLLHGDSDVLWCEFLMAEGVLERAAFAARNADMEARYKAGTVGVAEFADFYVGTLAGRTAADWEPLRQRFLREMVLPRIPNAARRLVQDHRESGALVAMTTATNRFITELTAQHLGIEHLLATEPLIESGRFTGSTHGTLNMREGKVQRLHDWLAGRSLSLAGLHSTAYSDSINDLPLLQAVDVPVAVDPDPRLAAIAGERGWRVLSLR
ncbi:HAD family hydrolase [Caenimonas sedimenti]|uniref:HAD family hydrolase n=1 Tax=Caenimonas sedimenti TaxID=2596921 RepID=A0A562ZRG3_9BURK|nr:HAD family hydrolase [Caenimonas sedimenti]TWO70908.1 HAD family hydrolase [Caenimonas sedimenti]